MKDNIILLSFVIEFSKRPEIMSTFKPSVHQQGIYYFITDETGNAVVSAVAGSGKTTTIVNAMEFIPKGKTSLFLAFNRDIKLEIEKRVTPSPNIHIRTCHSFGFSVLKNYLGINQEAIFDSKYSMMLRDIYAFTNNAEFVNGNYTGDTSIIKKYNFQAAQMKLVSEMPFSLEDDADRDSYCKRILQLCDLGRNYMVKTVRELMDIAYKYDVEIINGECERALALIDLGAYYTEKIDFTDMVYLPNRFNLKTFQYDFVFIDECQDLNTCQRLLMLKAVKKDGGRFVAVGDEKQSIYGFCGADIDSFNILKNLPNTRELPLSVSYRCGKSIIALAKTIVPQIEHSEFAKEGVYDEKASYLNIKDGDMVLCRVTYPLVKLCMEYLKKGIKASISGRDIGTNLVNMIKNTKKKTLEAVYTKLYAELAKVKKNLIAKTKVTESEAEECAPYVNYKEKIQVIEILGKDCSTPEEVMEKINTIFSDDSKSGIILSTIHKAKGLEADKVYIIHAEKMPHPMAKQKWEKVQEENLRYVAYTRAKSYLGIVVDFDAYADIKDHDKSGSKDNEKVSQFVGQPGEKIKVQLTVIEIKEMETSWGDSTLTTMVDGDGNVFTKFGEINPKFLVSNHQEVQVGSIIKCNIVVKNHKTFNGINQTYISTLSKCSKK